MRARRWKLLWGQAMLFDSAEKGPSPGMQRREKMKLVFGLVVSSKVRRRRLS
jgi:hypothetical protein